MEKTAQDMFFFFENVFKCLRFELAIINPSRYRVAQSNHLSMKKRIENCIDIYCFILFFYLEYNQVYTVKLSIIEL